MEETNGAFTVNFQYGRRGSTLKAGTKTADPVAEDKAVKIYDKLVKSKMSKGYTEGEEGTPFQSTDLTERVSGITPQLLNEIDDAELIKLINDDSFVSQEKFDGERRMVKDKTTGINKKGLTVALPSTISDSIKTNCTIEGEIIGDTLYVFDLLKYKKDMRKEPYSKRLKILESLSFGENVVVVKTATGKKAKQKLYLLFFKPS